MRTLFPWPATDWCWFVGCSPTEGEARAFLGIVLPELQKCFFADS